MEGMEQIYREQTVTDEVKTEINGQNNIYKAVRYGYDGSLYHYIVKMIKIPNSINKLSYYFIGYVQNNRIVSHKNSLQ
jgi:hypothetical protein